MLVAGAGASTPTHTPGATQDPVSSENIDIAQIHYDGAGSQELDEYVEFRKDSRAIQLRGWTLPDEANHLFTFPSYVVQSG
jgi:hypothetical protein